MARYTKVATPLLLIMSVSPALADEGAPVSMFQATSALALMSRPTPACISAQELAITTAISKFTSRVVEFCSMSISDPSPRPSQPYGFLRQRSWVARSDYRSAPPTVSHRAHGVVTGLINTEKNSGRMGIGDTTPHAQIRWTSGASSNTFYLTGWLPTGTF